MNNTQEEITSLFLHKGWITALALTFLLTLAVHILFNHFYKKLYPKIERTHFAWDSSLLKALLLPAKVLVWTLGVSISLQLFAYHFSHDTLVSFFKPFRDTLLIFVFLWFLLRFIKNMEMEYFVKGGRAHKKSYDRTTVRAICQISRVGAITVATLLFLQTRNVNLSAVLAFGGAGGLIVGLAAKDLLSNFFGGLMVYLDRPFAVGDRILSQEKGFEGFVENVGWRLTRIRTLDKRPLYIPNSIFSNITVQNISRMSHRKINDHIGVRYKDAASIPLIVEEIEKMLKQHPEVDSNEIIVCRLDQCSSFSLNILILCFVKQTDFNAFSAVHEDILLKAMQIIEKQGAECAFPTTTLHLPNPLMLKETVNPLQPKNGE